MGSPSTNPCWRASGRSWRLGSARRRSTTQPRSRSSASRCWTASTTLSERWGTCWPRSHGRIQPWRGLTEHALGLCRPPPDRDLVAGGRRSQAAAQADDSLALLFLIEALHDELL